MKRKYKITNTHSHRIRTLLVSAPFTNPVFPSAALGTLKSVLQSHGWKADCLYLQTFLHKYLGNVRDLMLGWNYALGELFYACHLFPKSNSKRNLRRLFMNEFKSEDLYNRVVTALQQFNKHALKQYLNRYYDVVGFSVGQGQLTSSLYLAKRYKISYPKSKIVFGGPECRGEMGRSQLKEFSWLDYVVHGEGEDALLEIVESLENGRTDVIQGCSLRKGDKILSDLTCRFTRNLDNIPIPDYSDYFIQYNRCDAPFFVQALPLEINRGCWWAKCTFCNYHLHRPYREISPKRVYDIIDKLSDDYRLLDFMLVSDVGSLSLKKIAALLDNSVKEYAFYMAHRPTATQDEFEAMKKVGLEVLTLGIESLSTSLLMKMKKGISAIQNIQALKILRELGITTKYLLIHSYPGETKKEFEDTLTKIKKCWHLLHNFGETAFCLEYGSEMFNHPRSFGIKNIRPQPIYKDIFPSPSFKRLVYFRYDFDASRPLFGSYRNALKNEGWDGSKEPGLIYQDGRDYLVILDLRRGNVVNSFRLDNPAREIYLFCDRIRTLQDIKQRFKSLPLDEVKSRLRLLCRDSLMIREEDKYLSLATNRHLGGGYFFKE